MDEFYSILFGECNKAKALDNDAETASDAPTLSASMIQQNQAEKAMFRGKFRAYYEKYNKSTDFDAEPDTVMEFIYEDLVPDEGKKMIYSNSYANMVRIANALSEKIPNNQTSRKEYLKSLCCSTLKFFSARWY